MLIKTFNISILNDSVNRPSRSDSPRGLAGDGCEVVKFGHGHLLSGAPDMDSNKREGGRRLNLSCNEMSPEISEQSIFSSFTGMVGVNNTIVQNKTV